MWIERYTTKNITMHHFEHSEYHDFDFGVLSEPLVQRGAECRKNANIGSPHIEAGLLNLDSVDIRGMRIRKIGLKGSLAL